MKLVRTIAAALIGAALASAAVLAQAQTSPSVKGAITTGPGTAAGAVTADLTATVVAIDPASRTVTLKRANGEVSEIAVGDQVRNFNQIKLGDIVRAHYTQALALELKEGAPADAGPPKVENIVSPPAPAGAKPGGAVARKITATADVIAVDAAKGAVTLRGPEGKEVDLNVQDPAQLKNIKTGDHVKVTYVEALAISVEEP
ncbi:MAG TPA: hypothetical protein VEC10_02735, partial [Steroidobacteraceae bacterium]|nr:hypothetical protein [Steroidobacteraceae bacterium]